LIGQFAFTVLKKLVMHGQRMATSNVPLTLRLYHTMIEVQSE